MEVAPVYSTPRPAQALAQSVLTSRVRSVRLLYPQKESQRVKLACSWLSTDGKHRLEITVCACGEDYCQFSLTNIYIYFKTWIFTQELFANILVRHFLVSRSCCLFIYFLKKGCFSSESNHWSACGLLSVPNNSKE